MEEYYRNVEDSVKKRIIKFFNTELTDIQKEQLTKTEYIDEEVLKINRLNDVVDYFLEKMLSGLLNKECYKKISLDQNQEVDVPIGETLKNVLVDYYKVGIADRINYYPVLKPEAALDVDYLRSINNVFDSVVDKNAFNKNVDELSKIDELAFYINNTISNDIDTYLNNTVNHSR